MGNLQSRLYIFIRYRKQKKIISQQIKLQIKKNK